MSERARAIGEEFVEAEEQQDAINRSLATDDEGERTGATTHECPPGFDDVLLPTIAFKARQIRELEQEPYPITEARRQFRALIRDAHAAGHTLRAIGEAAGISHQRVSQLLAKEEK